MRIYDPRLDSRPGAHACDPLHSSHVESRNPVLIALAFDIMRSPHFETTPSAWQALMDSADYCEELVDMESQQPYKPNMTGAVEPPRDMMAAARLSLSPTGFANLMARTGGRAPTAAELVEFADAERQAGVVPPHEQAREGSIAAESDGVAAAMTGAASA